MQEFENYCRMIVIGDDMKKIKWLILGMCFFMISVVNAATNDTTVRVEYWNNVYGNFLIEDKFYWNQMGITYANDKLAYCLEPGKWITESIYDSYTDFNIKNFSDALKQKLELIAYYGYEYKGHQTKEYYLATQELIWRELGIRDMYWSTGAVHGGDRIDVTHEINTIQRLMNSHHHMPSFHNKTYEMRSGEELRLEDTNGVFQDYEVLPPAPHGTSIANNHLTIMAGRVGNTTLSFIRNPNFYRVSLLYTKNNSQALASFGLSNKIIAKVNVKVTGYTLELHKKDFDHKNEIPSGEASLKGAIYEVTNHLDFLKTVETDEKGYAHIENIPAGNYEIKEKKASPGYELDPKTYTIHVGIDTSLQIELDVYEKVIENEIEFIKVASDGTTGIMEPEANITFAIYNKGNELVKELTTDENGIARTTLPYGTYLVKQLTTTPNYEKVDDFEIHVREKMDEPIRYVMNDAPVQARIKLKKQDEYGSSIKENGITFKIRNIDTGEYVKQKLEYPDERLVEEFVTNDAGEVITPYPLEAGHYEIEEITVPTGYLRPQENVTFVLDENTTVDKTETGNMVSIPIINYSPKGQIMLWKYGKSTKLIKNEMGMYDQIQKEELLNGVTFALYAGEDIIQNEKVLYQNGEVIGEFITENGVITTPELPLGTYCMKEIASLPEYQVDSSPQCITLKYQDADTKLIVENVTFMNEKIKRQTIIQKYGEEMTMITDGKGVYQKIPLAQVTFSVIADQDIIDDDVNISKDAVIYERLTDQSGKIVLENLPVGNYRLHEKKTPSGYEKIKDIKFSVTGENDVQTIEVINHRKKGNITIMKVDSDTNVPLDGAIFKLYNKEKKVLADHIVASSGILKLEQLAFDTYYLEEVKAPNGYMKEEVRKMIQIKSENIEPILFGNHKSILPNTSSINLVLYFIGGTLLLICFLSFLLSFILKKDNGK